MNRVEQAIGSRIPILEMLRKIAGQGTGGYDDFPDPDQRPDSELDQEKFALLQSFATILLRSKETSLEEELDKDFQSGDKSLLGSKISERIRKIVSLRAMFKVLKVSEDYRASAMKAVSIDIDQKSLIEYESALKAHQKRIGSLFRGRIFSK